VHSSKRKQVLIIGPYPPPYGGVSIHIKRLKELLAENLEIDIIDESKTKKENVFSLRSFNLIGYLRRIARADMVHIHSGTLSLRLLHFLFSSFFLKKIIFTIHAYEPGRSNLEKTLDRFMLNVSSEAILVSKEIANRLGIRKFILKEAFLPPDKNEEAELPHDIVEWINAKKALGYKICSANAWRLDSHKNEDVYGLDLCISSAIQLRDQGIKAAFVFIVCEDSGVIPVSKYRNLIRDAGLENCFLLFESPVSFIKLILQSDMVLRPTNTDGDALTVREGLYLGKIVIASDVVIRPEGTRLFRNREVGSLVNSIKEAMCCVTKTINMPLQDACPSSYSGFYLKEIYA
jgi:glycosyltransferase involved in cell wall biosynthesis